MDRNINLENQIPGWGADLDPSRRPAYPKEHVPENGTGAHWDMPEQQVPPHKIFKSVEHARLTPVFGTSVAPVGLSGLIRGWAYTMSEARPMHWMLLLAADRVNVVEGILMDLSNGIIPNPIKERGLLAEMKHNPAAFARRMFVWGAGAGVLAGMLFRMRGSARAARAMRLNGKTPRWQTEI